MIHTFPFLCKWQIMSPNCKI